MAGNPLVVVYPLYTPEHSASGSIDYKVPIGAVTASLHLDGNFATSQYTSSNDPTKSDKSFTMNGRLSLGGFRMSPAGAELTFSLWARNLTNNAYTFVENFNASLGTYAIFNEPRTYGFEARVKF